MNKRPLKDLSRREYETLKRMGFLWEFYPEASGDYDADQKALRNNGGSRQSTDSEQD